MSKNPKKKEEKKKIIANIFLQREESIGSDNEGRWVRFCKGQRRHADRQSASDYSVVVTFAHVGRRRAFHCHHHIRCMKIFYIQPKH